MNELLNKSPYSDIEDVVKAATSIFVSMYIYLCSRKETHSQTVTTP